MRSTKESGKRLRIGLVTAHLKGINVDVLQYVFLHMNTLQDTFQYEFLPPIENDPFLDRLKKRRHYDSTMVADELPGFSTRCVAELALMSRGYDLNVNPPRHFILLSMAKLSDHYYIQIGHDSALLALGNWRRAMAPPSIIEFFAFLTVPVAASFLAPTDISRFAHVETKGCIGDFTPCLEDARYQILNGFICSECRDAMCDNGMEDVIPSIESILDRSWLGSLDMPMSPASISSKLGHNLFVTKGLKPTCWETAMEILAQEGPKQVLKVLSGVLLAALIIWLGLKVG